MSNQTVKALAAFANIKTNAEDEFSADETLGIPAEVKEAILAIEKEKRDKEAREAATVIVNILEFSKKFKEHLVASVRQARKTEKLQLKRLKEIERAAQYAQETGNYFPLGADYFSYSEELEAKQLGISLEIPKDWEPSKGETEE